MLRSQISRSKVRSQLQDLLRKACSARRVRAELPALLPWLLEGEVHKHLPYPLRAAAPGLQQSLRATPPPAGPSPATTPHARRARPAATGLAGPGRPPAAELEGSGRRPLGSQLDPPPCLAVRPAPVHGRTAARCTPSTLSSRQARAGCGPAARHCQRPAALPQESAPEGPDSRCPRAGAQPLRAHRPPLAGALRGPTLRASRGPHQQCHRAVLREDQTGPAPTSGPRSSGARHGGPAGPDRLEREPAASGLRADPMRHAGPIAPGLSPTGLSDLQPTVPTCGARTAMRSYAGGTGRGPSKLDAARR